MERFITTMILSFLMAVSGIMAFAGNVATVREGRIWEYVYEEGSGPATWSEFDGDPNLVMFRMWFDGTEERDGREYHRLVYSDSITVWSYVYVGEGQDEFKSIRHIPNVHKETFLMREEDSRIYLLYDDKFEGVLDPEPGHADELLIYDFSCREGNSYDTDFCMQYWAGTPSWYHGFAPNTRMNIKSADTIQVDGEDALMQTGRITVDWDSYPDSEEGIDYLMIEGIGSVTHGCLPFICNDQTTEVRYHDFNLNRVYNDKGEVIYRGEDIDTSTLSVGRIAADAGSLSFANGTVKAVGNGEVSLTIYDINGRSVATDNATESTEIETEGLPHGIYIAVCRSQLGIKALRIML